MYNVKETINNAVTAALKESIAQSMKNAAQDAVSNVLGNFIGDILDEETFNRYCGHVYWDISKATDEIMNQVFDVPATEEELKI